MDKSTYFANRKFGYHYINSVQENKGYKDTQVHVYVICRNKYWETGKERLRDMNGIEEDEDAQTALTGYKKTFR